MNREIINITNQNSVTVAWNDTRKANFGLFPCMEIWLQFGTPLPTGNTNPYTISGTNVTFVASNTIKINVTFANLVKVGDILTITNTVSNNRNYTVTAVTPYYIPGNTRVDLTVAETVNVEGPVQATITHTVTPGTGYYYQKQDIQAVLDAPPPSTTTITFNFNTTVNGFIILL